MIVVCGGKAYGGIGRYTKEIVLWLLQHRDWEFSLLVAKEAYADLWSYVINNQIRLLPFDVPILSIKEQFFCGNKFLNVICFGRLI